MAWARNYVALRTGERVRYSFVERAGSDVYFVRFRSLDGRRVERAAKATRKVDAIDEAPGLFVEECQQVAPSSERVPWQVAKEKVAEAKDAFGELYHLAGEAIERYAVAEQRSRRRLRPAGDDVIEGR
jgi:hypothetical protein